MAIKQAWIMCNGTRVNATYNSDTQTWTAQITAPAQSSWSQPNHVYGLEIHAEDDAGNQTVMDSTDETYGDELKLRVLEKTKPTATITSPTEGSVLGATTQQIKFTIKDAGGSGLNMDSVNLRVNSVKVTSGISYTDGTDGEKIGTYTATNLSDGANKIQLTVQDNDGNASDEDVVNFVISTAAPTLNVTSPTEGLITNSETVTVAGTAAAGSDAVTLSEVTVNGEGVALSGGSFSKQVTLTEGENTITIIAKDSIGKTTTVTRHVTLDTKAPVITDVVASATTVDASGNLTITFKVTDPAA